MLTGPAAEIFKSGTGHQDEAVAKLSSGVEKLFKNIPKMVQYQAVAEVVKSEHCFAQLKVGDKLVFDPFLNPQKSTGAMCPEALLPILVRIAGVWEMMAEWAESGKEELPEISFSNVRCLDPGLEDGGVGGVVYQIRGEKMAP